MRGGFRPVRRTELRKHITQVKLDGTLTHTQRRRDVRVARPFGDEREHLLLSLGERVGRGTGGESQRRADCGKTSCPAATWRIAVTVERRDWTTAMWLSEAKRLCTGPSCTSSTRRWSSSSVTRRSRWPESSKSFVSGSEDGTVPSVGGKESPSSTREVPAVIAGAHPHAVAPLRVYPRRRWTHAYWNFRRSRGIYSETAARGTSAFPPRLRQSLGT
jgi:hypothetical protein